MTRREICATMAGMMGLAGCDKLRLPSSQPEKAAVPAIDPAKGEPAKTPPGETLYVQELELDYAILLNDGAAPKRVTEKNSFRSGDRFRIEFRPGARANLYLLNRGAGQGGYSFLYPNRRIAQTNPLTAGQSVIVPGEPDWFTFDSTPGTENLVLIASADPIPAFSNTDAVIPRDEGERQIAVLERDHRPSSSRRFEDHDWVKLYSSWEKNSVIVVRLPLDHH